MKCPKCNEEIKEGSIICPSCGNKMEQEQKQEQDKEDRNWNGLIIGCSAVISAIGILFIKSELSPLKFFMTYLIIFIGVYLCLGLIYLIFFKDK